MRQVVRSERRLERVDEEGGGEREDMIFLLLIRADAAAWTHWTEILKLVCAPWYGQDFLHTPRLDVVKSCQVLSRHRVYESVESAMGCGRSLVDDARPDDYNHHKHHLEEKHPLSETESQEQDQRHQSESTAWALHLVRGRKSSMIVAWIRDVGGERSQTVVDSGQKDSGQGHGEIVLLCMRTHVRSHITPQTLENLFHQNVVLREAGSRIKIA